MTAAASICEAPARTPAPSATRRYLAVWLPFLPADRLNPSSAPDEAPLVIIEKDRGALRIAALNPAAVAMRLKTGMALADARAWVPSLRAVDADPVADAACLARAAAACALFTPLVALDGTDGIILDITGSAHLFGGEAALRLRVRQRLKRLGLTSTATIACTPDAARALARHARIGVVATGDEGTIVRDLPVAALDCDGSVRIALGRAGLKTLGDLDDRPSPGLAARFGADLPVLLARIFGRQDRRITPLRRVPDCIAERHFPEPLSTLPALDHVLAGLARDICAMLEQRAQGGRRFEARFFRADGAVRHILIETGVPCRDPAVILRLFRLKSETLADPIDPGFGFDALRLGVGHAETLETPQGLLEGAADAPSAADRAALIDRLAARFGRARVTQFVTRDTHDPARAGGLAPAQGEPVSPQLPALLAGEPPARPLTLFDPPQPVEALAEVPDGPPLRFRWRRMSHDIARSEGPERIAPEWWQSTGSVGENAPATRDYYRIEDAAGRRFWVFREGFYGETLQRPRWYVHGLFA